MKKFIKSSSSKFKNIDSVKFATAFNRKLREVLPDICTTQIDPQYTEISIYDCPSRSTLVDSTISALSLAGYDVYDIAEDDDEGYDFAAVDGNRFVKIVISYNSDDKAGYLDFGYDNGNVEFQDWY